ncbi:dual specificity mitogen-activated protein kinase kinase 1 [Colletotrichum plurivorum]|uniref:EKC/KEOPS complex subunit BUD32 n=1 Tax=Colletotrichum plurivorum TaxID=2175906 RepID=A0A8H6JAV8_9PEZI|nr:dual specificity mitogen-activated protein kinase kinase 1 [Colletotrichum plurivorum]
MSAYLTAMISPFRPFTQNRAATPAAPNGHSGDHIDNQLHYLCSLNVPEHEAHNGRTSQKNIQDIQVYLDLLDKKAARQNDSKWSRRPRLYAILRNVGALEYMNAFIDARATDFHLPFNPTTIPDCLKDESRREVREAFLKAQFAYLTSARYIEQGHDSRHWILPSHTSGDDYFIPEKRLGHGSFGSVDLVFSRLSIERYARKRVVRGRSEQSRRNEHTLLNELKELRQLRHDHLIKIFGSYTDKDYIAYLMKPIAEVTLDQFLSRRAHLDPAEQVMMRRFYGCLAGAVDYLHRNHIRHRDLTARNVLIYKGDPYISDFGSAYNWANKTGSMTRHKNTPVSPDYMAPEVAREEERGTASDMWSLGVLYLEMTTKLLGRRTQELKAHLDKHAKLQKVKPFPYANIPAIFSWIKHLGNLDTEYDHDKEPLGWVRSLLDSQPDNRPISRILVQDIRDSASFSTFCCFKCQPMYQDDAAEYPIPERAGPAVSSQETSAMVENFMETFERRSSFGGMPVQRVDSIKEWISGTADTDVHDPATSTQLEDIREETAPDDNPRLTDRLQYATYEYNYYQSTTARDPDPTLWGHNAEDLAIPGAFPAPETYDTCTEPQETAPSNPLPQDDASPTTTRSEKHELKDSGLGFLEYDSVSSDNGDPAFQPFDEVSDRSTINSDDMSQAADLEDGTREQCTASDDEDEDVQICDPGRAFDNPDGTGELLFGEVDDESDSEAQPEKLFDEVSDTSDVEPPAKSPSLPAMAWAHPINEQLIDELNRLSEAGSLDASKNLDGDQDTLVGDDGDSVAPETAPRTRTDSDTDSGLHRGHSPVRLPRRVGGFSETNKPDDAEEQKARHEVETAPAIPDTRMSQHEPAKDERAEKVEEVPLSVSSSSDRRERRKQKKVRIEAPTETKPVPKVSGKDKATGTSKASQKGDPKKPRRRPAERGELPVINADKLITDTWELASSAPTTAVSENTKTSLSMFFLMIPSSAQVQATLTGHCRNGKASAVRFMLENMPPYKNTKTLLRKPVWACIKGASTRHNKCLRALIDAGASINAKSESTGKTPLHAALEHDDFKGYTNLIWLLISKGARPNAKDRSGDCPLTKLLTGNDSLPLGRHRLAALAILLQGGAEVGSAQPGTGNTPLHLAVRRQDKLAVAMLLYKGAGVDAKTNWGTTPLQMTANQFRGHLADDHAQVLDLLLRGGAAVDEPAGQDRRTALHRAVATGTAQAVEMLLARGASPTLRDGSGRDARALAVENAAKLTRDGGKVLDRRIDDHVEIMERLFADKKREWPMNRGRCLVDVLCYDPGVDGKRIFGELFEMGLQKNAKFGDKGTIADLYSKVPPYKDPSRRAL